MTNITIPADVYRGAGLCAALVDADLQTVRALVMLPGDSGEHTAPAIAKLETLASGEDRIVGGVASGYILHCQFSRAERRAVRPPISNRWF
jgi:hypothetical protein